MLWSILASSILGMWFLCSVLGQFSGTVTEKTVRRFDWFSLIPRWSFFAPNPGTSDYHLLFRDKLANRSITAWREVDLTEKRTLLGSVWNPQKRRQKVLSDSVSGLLRLSRNMEDYGLKTTLPYLAILNFIASLPRNGLSVSTQFMLMESKGYRSDIRARMLFVSEMHRLTRREP